MINQTNSYNTLNQGVLPFFISDCLDICDPVFTFDELVGGMNLEKYLKNVPEHKLGRIRYNPVKMLKTVLFSFMSEGYISLRGLQENCKVKKGLTSLPVRHRNGSSVYEGSLHLCKYPCSPAYNSSPLHKLHLEIAQVIARSYRLCSAELKTGKIAIHMNVILTKQDV